jgi:hypothetical protein
VNKIGNAERHRRGTFKSTQATRELVRPKEPSPALKRVPPGLTKSQKFLYRRTVAAAPWLELADLSSLILWVKAFDAVMLAPDLKSVKGEALLAANLGSKLGLTPHGRMALGITNQPSAAPAADAWSELRRGIAA